MKVISGVTLNADSSLTINSCNTCAKYLVLLVMTSMVSI